MLVMQGQSQLASPRLKSFKAEDTTDAFTHGLRDFFLSLSFFCTSKQEMKANSSSNTCVCVCNIGECISAKKKSRRGVVTPTEP